MKNIAIFAILLLNHNIISAQEGPPGGGPIGPSSQLCNSVYQLNPYWYDGQDKLFTVCDAVKVGIGTQFPLYKLHIVGTTYGQNILMGNSSASTSALYNGFSSINRPSLMKLGLKIGSQSEQLLFNFTGDGTFEINNKLGPAMIVHSSTGSKIMQLENDGLLRARGVRVDEDNWPDFVFAADYKIPSLSFVKDYISKNSHLPGIPSAKEIETKGLDLGEVTKLQMQKIEELTLYTIEQEEKIAYLEKRLLKLERLIK